MTLRMHPVSAARWAALATTRHPIDLTEEPVVAKKADRGRRRRTEHARIQATVDALAAKRVSASH